MLTSNAKVIKCILFFVNLLYVITGITLIFIGATVRARYTDYQQIVDSKLHSISIFLIVVGFIIFVVSFFGCCGAFTENRCMILIFSTLITVILLIEIALAVAGYVFSQEAKDLVGNNLKETMNSYGEDTETTDEWDLWQTNLECCGVNGFFDWAQINKTIPWSCCSGPGGLNTTVCAPGPKIHHTGCYKALTDFVKDESMVVGNAALILSIIHLLSVFMSCYLAKAIATSEYESV